MTLLETMAIIYAVSIPLSFFVFKWLIKHYGEMLQGHTSYDLGFIFNVLTFVPIVNTMMVLYAIYDFGKYHLIDRWKNEDDDANEKTVDVDDLKP